MTTFFCPDDYERYIGLLRCELDRSRVEVWAWCLMPNHVHLVLVPSHPRAMSEAMAEAHRRYALQTNLRSEWRGRFWQGPFQSCPMSPRHSIRCARYIEMNPVRAGLVERPEDWPWSSARGHLSGRDDGLGRSAPLLAEVGDWRSFLDRAPTARELEQFRVHVGTGRPLGSRRYFGSLERRGLMRSPL